MPAAGYVGAKNGPRGRGRPRDPALDDAILHAAYELLLEEGVRGFTLLEVARRAGVPKSTVYRRWPSRKEMLTAALTHLAAQHDAVPDTGSLRGDLIRSVEIQIDALTEGGRAFARLGLEAAGDAELAPIVKDALYKRRRAFDPMFQRAIARGELRPEVDFETALDLVFGPMWSRLISQRLDLDASDAEPIVDRALRGLSQSYE